MLFSSCFIFHVLPPSYSLCFNVFVSSSFLNCRWFVLRSEPQKKLKRRGRIEVALQLSADPSSSLSHTEPKSQPRSICTSRHLSWECCEPQPPSVQVRVSLPHWHQLCLSLTESGSLILRVQPWLTKDNHLHYVEEGGSCTVIVTILMQRQDISDTASTLSWILKWF